MPCTTGRRDLFRLRVEMHFGVIERVATLNATLKPLLGGTGPHVFFRLATLSILKK
jgi:hypothetical protein